MAAGRIIVVGTGAAGVWAALAAQRAGASVAVLRQAPGATAVSSGCIDLACGTDTAGQPLAPVQAAAAIGRKQHTHPYAAIGAALPEAIERARGFLTETHSAIGMTASADRNLLLATPLGTVKETWLAQGSLARGDLRSWSRGELIGVVELPNRSAFDARAVAAGLTALGYQAVPLPVAFEIHPFAATSELARQLDQPEAADRFVAAVVAAARQAGARYVLVPTAGTVNPTALLDRLVAGGLAQAAEMVGVPPSVPGLRFQHDLEARLAAASIEVISGVAHEALRSRDRIERLKLEDGRELQADAFILASGRFIGGGIRHEGSFRETVFGLPVFVNGQDVADKWLGDMLDRNAAATQAALKAGVAVDASMRPVDDRGHVVLENVFAAGSVIGGYDPAKDGSGLGVAALTALLAGENAAAEARDHAEASAETDTANARQASQGAAAEDPRT